MKTIIALALALGIVSAVVVYAGATWQVQNAGPPPAARFAAALASETEGQTAMLAPSRPAPSVSWRWPAITGGAVAVVVAAAGAAFILTGKR